MWKSGLNLAAVNSGLPVRVFVFFLQKKTLYKMSKVPTVNITNEGFVIENPLKSGSIVIDKDTDTLFFSDSKQWHQLVSDNSNSFSNIGEEAEVLVEGSSKPVQFRTIKGESNIKTTQSSDLVTISGVPDISFSLDKSGTQIVNGINTFTFTTITNWDILGIGRYNTGSFNNSTGVFTADIKGKYLFTSIIRCSQAPNGLEVFLRLFHITQAIQLAQVSAGTSASTINGGLILQLTHEVQLEEGDQVDLQICLLDAMGAASMQIDPFLGSSVFTGRLTRFIDEAKK